MSAIIFPGQGAQYVGMGKSLYDSFPRSKEIFSSIDNILGFELSEKCFGGPAHELKDTAIQQLAILAVSLAAFSIFKEKNIQIDYLSGLSLGEYSCLYAGGVLSLEDVVILVKLRGEAMQKAACHNPSTMFAVIGADREFLEKKASQENFYIANINSSKQIVISLSQDNKEKVESFFQSRQGLRAIELGVSGGFHAPFMNEAKESLTESVKKMNFHDARIPIVSNFTAKCHTKKEEIKNNLLEQLVSPVLWKDCVDFMIGAGVDLFFEVGPSKVLRGLMRKINTEVKVVNIEKKEDLEQFAAV